MSQEEFKRGEGKEVSTWNVVKKDTNKTGYNWKWSSLLQYKKFFEYSK